MANKIKAPKTSSSAIEKKSVQLLLRSGVILSVALMVVGLSAQFWIGSAALVSVSIADLFSGKMPWPQMLVVSGILVLALTPVFRVITLIFLWGREKDWKFVAVSCVVLITLTLSFFLGGI